MKMMSRSLAFAAGPNDERNGLYDQYDATNESECAQAARRTV